MTLIQWQIESIKNLLLKFVLIIYSNIYSIERGCFGHSIQQKFIITYNNICTYVVHSFYWPVSTTLIEFYWIPKEQRTNLKQKQILYEMFSIRHVRPICITLNYLSEQTEANWSARCGQIVISFVSHSGSSTLFGVSFLWSRSWNN